MARLSVSLFLGFAPSEKAMPELLQEMKRKLKQGIHTLQEKMVSNNHRRFCLQ